MLANGAKLEFKSGESYQKLDGLKEIPEMGIEYEKVENTGLDDTVKIYENGIGDSTDLTYKFKYDNSSASSPYRVMRQKELSGEDVEFKETLKDGTTTTFAGPVTVKRSGGAVNGVMEFDLTVSPKSAPTVVDPE